MKRVYSFRIDEDLWRKMKRHPYINWSEVIREAIVKRLAQEKENRVGYAVKLHMEILSRIKPSNTDITEIIRKYRDQR